MKRKRKTRKTKPETPKPRVVKEILYFATYNGLHKVMRMTGISDKYVIPGKEYSITLDLANALRRAGDWRVRQEKIYE